MKQSKFIVIEGLDGSGKSTQLELLQSYLEEKGVIFRHVHFPRLGQGVYGTLVADFLRGAFGKLEEVHPKLVALLYAGDRKDFAETIAHWLAEGILVIADRYVYSNIAFQCAKCIEPREKEELKQWILDLEYGYYKIPKPDFSLFLDVSIVSAAKALSEDDERTTRDYLNGSQDIHESDLDFQERVHQEYLNLTRSEEDIHRLLCVDKHGQRLSPDYTHRAIIRKLQEMNIL